MGCTANSCKMYRALPVKILRGSLLCAILVKRSEISISPEEVQLSYSSWIYQSSIRSSCTSAKNHKIKPQTYSFPVSIFKPRELHWICKCNWQCSFCPGHLHSTDPQTYFIYTILEMQKEWDPEELSQKTNTAWSLNKSDLKVLLR